MLRWILFMWCLVNCQMVETYAFYRPELDSTMHINQWLRETEQLIQKRQSAFIREIQLLEEALNKVNSSLKEISPEEEKKCYQLWIQKLELIEKIQIQQEAYNLDIAKLRYKKGIELIRLLYEKVLGLDHHFTSLQTFQHVAMLSNPNQNPDFQMAKDWIEGHNKRKPLLKMPEILETNPYLSSSVYLVKLLMGTPEADENKPDINEIACIMDFTVRMNSELNTIYYETEYLQENNQSLIEACALLFEEYTKVVGYKVPLPKCRDEDDWRSLSEYLDAFMEEIAKALESGSQITANKKQIDLEFAVDRLLEFINTYNGFINQGEKYYQKFFIILNNYTNEATCLETLPEAYLDMKAKVEDSITKFREAYDIAEIRGSKLKDLLYGFQ